MPASGLKLLESLADSTFVIWGTCHLKSPATELVISHGEVTWREIRPENM